MLWVYQIFWGELEVQGVRVLAQRLLLLLAPDGRDFVLRHLLCHGRVLWVLGCVCACGRQAEVLCPRTAEAALDCSAAPHFFIGQRFSRVRGKVQQGREYQDLLANKKGLFGHLTRM